MKSKIKYMTEKLFKKNGITLLIFLLPIFLTTIFFKIQQPTNIPAQKSIISIQKQILSANTDTKEQASLIRVVDGDTIVVSLNGKNETIRIIGINSPETVDPRRPIECMGKEASNYAKNYFEQTDKKLWLEKDPSQADRDKYRRLLRYVFTDNATVDYGKTLIKLGYANEYTYNTPYKYQKAYKLAEQEAQKEKKGLWADNICGTYTTTNSPKVGDKDCQDFTTQTEAQAYFDSKGGSASNNVDNLDGSDRDGIVCEWLK